MEALIGCDFEGGECNTVIRNDIFRVLYARSDLCEFVMIRSKEDLKIIFSKKKYKTILSIFGAFRRDSIQ